jgi:hypothetical protein
MSCVHPKMEALAALLPLPQRLLLRLLLPLLRPRQLPLLPRHLLLQLPHRRPRLPWLQAQRRPRHRHPRRPRLPPLRIRYGASSPRSSASRARAASQT